MWIMSHNWSINLYIGYQFRAWRLLLLVFMIPGIISGLWLYKFPESPKYLLNKNKDKEVLEIFEWMYRMNKKGNDNFNIKSIKFEVIEKRHEQEKCL
jgi:MFS transporter, VNT family, synaptic vesicle glycoprotein 2